LRGGPSILIPVLIPAFTLYTTACSSAGSGSDTLVVTRDSAGIVIVENAAPVWGDTDGWRLGAEPELAIGVAAGDDAYLLFQVASALRLPDGRVVVANGSTKEIRFYDSTGNHLSSVGGMGSGPGEFRDIGLFTAYRSDSLLVFDRAQQRVTVLDRYGELGRVTRLGAKSGTFPSLRAALADGRLLARSTEVTRTGQPWRLWRDTIVITRYGPDGTDSGPLVRLPGMDRYTVDFDGNISVNNHPMGRIPEIATDGSAVYYLDGGELTVDVYSDDGLLIRSIRARYGRKPVTGEVIEETKAAWLGDSPTPDDRRTVERIFAQMEAPDLLPAAAGCNLLTADVKNDINRGSLGRFPGD